MLPRKGRPKPPSPRSRLSAGRTVEDTGAGNGVAMGLREHLVIETLNAEDGRARSAMDAGDDHLNDAGSVHGGAIATLADAVMGSAVQSTLDDHVPVTVEASVRFLEPGRKGRIVGEARVRRPGKKFIVVEAEIVQEESSEHVAFATATFTAIGD